MITLAYVRLDCVQKTPPVSIGIGTAALPNSRDPTSRDEDGISLNNGVNKVVHGPYKSIKEARESHPKASIIRPFFRPANERQEYLVFDNSYDALWHPT